MLNLELFLINYPAFRTFQKNIFLKEVMVYVKTT